MAGNKIAVAVIHGMGSQGKDQQGTNEISFSAGLYTRLKEQLGADFFDRVAWREIFWADILQTRQEDYIQYLRSKGARWMDTRRFVMHNLGDAASYRKNDDPRDQIYFEIHERVHRTIQRLEQIGDPHTPLIVLAHSLGGHIMSNYIYDMMKGTPQIDGTSDFQKLRTMAAFVTFGCNIPVFSFSYQPDHIHPIQYPGTGIAADKRLTPWWYNYNDKDDALGMPLAGLSPGYGALAASGELRDRWVSTGGLFQFWNPASHNQYWTSRNFYKPVAGILRKAMEIGPVSPDPVV
jgi:hypothetical protein